jgi:hypothetical protein
MVIDKHRLFLLSSTPIGVRRVVRHALPSSGAT